MTDNEQFARLASIHAMLQAYANGWISYDADDVRRLQEERARIIRGEESESSNS